MPNSTDRTRNTAHNIAGRPYTGRPRRKPGRPNGRLHGTATVKASTVEAASAMEPATAVAPPAVAASATGRGGACDQQERNHKYTKKQDCLHFLALLRERSPSKTGSGRIRSNPKAPTRKKRVNLESESRRTSVYLRWDRGFIYKEYLEGKGEILYCPEHVKVNFIINGNGKFDSAVDDRR